MLSPQWGQGTKSNPMWRSPKLPLLPQSATRSHGTFSSPYPLARMAPTSARSLRRDALAQFPGALPFSDSPGLSKDGYCFDSGTASLSLSAFGTEENGQRTNWSAPPPPSVLWVLHGVFSANSEAQLREWLPTAPRSGALRGREKRLRRTGRGRKG